MSKIINTNDVNFWRTNLGLLPVPLFQEKKTSEKFVMLNGSYGNFCLDFSKIKGDERSHAWSSNVDHYVNIFDNKVSVQRWDKFYPTNYSLQSVDNKIHEFYDFLRKDKTESNLNIVSFSLNIFRQLRAVLRDDKGNNTVNAFLFLLAYHAGGHSKRNEVDLKKWALPQTALSTVSAIRDGDWESIYEMMSDGLPNIGLVPNTNLILRHASGSLFQEAHFETNYPVQYQITLDGFLPSAVSTNKKTLPSSSHYTPTSIVRTIVEEVLSKQTELPKKIKILDPACGSAEFLREIIRQLTIAGYKGEISVVGWDISQTATDMAKYILAFEKSQAPVKISIDVQTLDALAEDSVWPDDIDIVLMNPPFISWELLSKSEKNTVQNTLGNVFEKKPNLAAAFLWKAYNTLKKDGHLGLILPSSILEGDSNAKLRKELEGNISISLLGKLGSLNLFSDALVDASVLVARKGKSNEVPVNLWCDYNKESSSNALRNLRILRAKKNTQPVFDSTFSIFKNKLLGKNDRWIPVSYKSWEILESVKDLSKVKDLFEVKQGIRTGMNTAFLIDKTYYSKLSKTEKVFFRPAITNESIVAGHLNDDVFIFYPYGKDIIEINSEKDLIKHVPTFYKDYLKPNFNQLKNRQSVAPAKWWNLSRQRKWQEDKFQKLVTKEFGKAGALAFDKKGVFVAERGHAWLPLESHKALFTEEIGYAYVAVFSMEIVNDLLNAVSKQIGGGQWYLASKFIDEMPIPNLFDKKFDQNILNELTSIGKLLAKGEEINVNNLNRLSQSTFLTK